MARQAKMNEREWGDADDTRRVKKNGCEWDRPGSTGAARVSRAVKGGEVMRQGSLVSNLPDKKNIN